MLDQYAFAPCSNIKHVKQSQEPGWNQSRGLENAQVMKFGGSKYSQRQACEIPFAYDTSSCGEWIYTQTCIQKLKCGSAQSFSLYTNHAVERFEAVGHHAEKWDHQ